jgi:hypothetical protein
MRGGAAAAECGWARPWGFDWQQDVPLTKSPTEQVIGKTKMRVRTVRSYKTWPKMASGLMVAGVGFAQSQSLCNGSRLPFPKFTHLLWDKHC